MYVFRFIKTNGVFNSFKIDYIDNLADKNDGLNDALVIRTPMFGY